MRPGRLEKVGRAALLTTGMAIALAACGASGVTRTASGTTGGSAATTIVPAGNEGVTTTIADPAGVDVEKLSDSDAQALVEAFESWEDLPSTCPAEIVPNSAKVAVISRTGDSWAIAAFEPAPSCVFPHVIGPGLPTSTFDPQDHGPFVPGITTIGVFEGSGGNAWVMNEEGGAPFPCPAPGGAAPGPGNGAIPGSVLTAWGLAYAANCITVLYPLEPDP
jgi:hypothetical protein